MAKDHSKEMIMYLPRAVIIKSIERQKPGLLPMHCQNCLQSLDCRPRSFCTVEDSQRCWHAVYLCEECTKIAEVLRDKDGEPIGNVDRGCQGE